MEKSWMYGYADSDGIQMLESEPADYEMEFFSVKTPEEINTDQFTLAVKATADQSKKGVLFRALLSPGDVQTIQASIYGSNEAASTGKLSALKVLKENSDKVQVASWGLTKPEAKKRWVSLTSSL
jgi:hypothetical protein